MNLPVEYSKCKNRKEVREEYVKLQDGLCAYCAQPLSGPPPKEIQDTHILLSLFPVGFLKNPVHLQHDHQTGLTEGAVHARCNAILWQYYGR